MVMLDEEDVEEPEIESSVEDPDSDDDDDS